MSGNVIKGSFFEKLGKFLREMIGLLYRFSKVAGLIWGKKVHGYLISFEPHMVQSSYKDHLIRLFLRSAKLKYRLP